MFKFIFAFLLINWPYNSQNPVEQLQNRRTLPIFDPWSFVSGPDHAPWPRSVKLSPLSDRLGPRIHILAPPLGATGAPLPQ